MNIFGMWEPGLGQGIITYISLDLFCELEFSGRIEDAPLLEAIAFLQDLLRNGRSLRQVKPATFPVALIPKNLQRYLYTSEPGRKKRLDVRCAEHAQQLGGASPLPNLMVVKS
ncbi:MAG: hypothetical protein PPHEESC_1887 [uncultured Paraburkholderia sp.]|nr:MAG: hypothetical protein PPHEESC_1887 [uncultured Paraburkholderia sp.]